MQRFQRGVFMLAAIVLVAAAARARAQGTLQGNTYIPESMTQPDSAVVDLKTYRFRPVYTNNIDGKVSYVSMTNQLSTSLSTPYPATLNFDVMKNEKHYRLNENSDLSKRLALSGLYLFPSGMIATLGYNDSRISNRYAISGGGLQNYIFNDNGFNGGLSYKRAYPIFRYDANASGSAMTGERAYKTDETFGGGGNGGVAVNLLGDRMVVQARGAFRETSETSRTTRSVFDGLGASEDSISSVVRVFPADSVQVTASYSAYNGTRDYTDQAQGSLGGQIPGEENVFQEREVKQTRATLISLNSVLFNNLLINLDTGHEEQLNDYRIQTTRYSNNTTDRVTGAMTYKLPWKTTVTTTFENAKSTRDYGTQSASSYDEERKRVSAGVGRNFTPTLRVDLSASTLLTQTSYKDKVANPRDRDQVDNLAGIRLSSQPYTNVSAAVSFSYASTHFINIDATQSANNRVKEHWELRPTYSWYFRPWLSITQAYGVVIEFTQYDDITGRDDDNFLDRNLIFTNTFNFRPYQNTRFRFDYSLYLHDKGSYLPTGPNGEDVLNVDTKDWRNQLTLRADYDANARLSFFADYRYNDFIYEDVVTGDQTPSVDGTISVGATGKYQWRKNRTFSFTLARVQKYGPNTTYKENNYWDMLSSLNFPL